MFGLSGEASITSKLSNPSCLGNDVFWSLVRLIDYLGFYVPLKNISLIWRRSLVRVPLKAKKGTSGKNTFRFCKCLKAVLNSFPLWWKMHYHDMYDNLDPCCVNIHVVCINDAYALRSH
jgi:hypothetical protein